MNGALCRLRGAVGSLRSTGTTRATGNGLGWGAGSRSADRVAAHVVALAVPVSDQRLQPFAAQAERKVWSSKRVFAERNLGYASARIIFQRLGIEAQIDFATDADGGLQKLLNGEGDAWIVSTGKVAPVIKNIQNEGGKVHLLSIPYERSLQDIYLPQSFSSDEYPNLVAPGTTVETVAAATVLMVYNWPVQSDRYQRVARFVNAMFDKIGQLKEPPRNAKWRDTVLSAPVPGLQRFKAAQDWLDNATTASEDTAKLRNEFLKWKSERDLQR